MDNSNCGEIATELYEESIDWLSKHYSSFRFFKERDIAWTVQNHIFNVIQDRGLPLAVYDNHKITGKELTDLVIVEEKTGIILVAAEFKYEPDHKRKDITQGKLNPKVVPWGDKEKYSVIQDIYRIKKLVDQDYVITDYVIFIDEGGHHTSHEEPEDCIWVKWGMSPYSPELIYVLIMKYCRK